MLFRKMEGEVVTLDAQKVYVEVELQLHIILTSALDGGDWSASYPKALTVEIYPCTH